MTELKRGQIAVNKKELITHCQCIHSALNYLDLVMKEPQSNERGKQIARAWNQINFSLHRLEHFELGVPLDKLGTKLPSGNFKINKK